jgi:2-methylcitrate dehydratase PrpD
VDMIGPWAIEVGDRKEKFSTLTIIDLVTNLVETVCVTNKTSAAVTAHFVNGMAHMLSEANVMYT